MEADYGNVYNELWERKLAREMRLTAGSNHLQKKNTLKTQTGTGPAAFSSTTHPPRKVL